jgi:transcriptional regulator with AAA-type ATPase domain/ferredoxin
LSGHREAAGGQQHPSPTVYVIVPIPLPLLRPFRILTGLSDRELAQVGELLRPCDFLSGRVILTKEDPADALYFILQGRVRVELRNAAGQIFNLLELGVGETFGERAILTDEPRTADVRAVTAVTAARLSRADFAALLPQIPKLYANLCCDLARQLGSWAQRYQREEEENRDLLSHAIGWQLLPEFSAFPGSSPWVKELNLRLQRLGSSHSHVLIVGEAGTWKDLAARLIHFHGANQRPLLFLDCAAPPLQSAGEETEFLRLERAQEAALFGAASSGAVSARRGMLELASGGALILRNVDSLQPGVQRDLRALLQSGRVQRRGEAEYRYAALRIIATSSEPLAGKAVVGVFDPGLYQLLQGESIVMLPLRERKKDIPGIARRLLRSLNAKHRKEVRRLSHEALNRLLDHDWPLNNSELYQVLSRAVLICEGDKILAEHIFLPGQSCGAGRFNLLTLPAVAELAQRPGFPRMLRWGTVPLFLLVSLYTLFGPVTDNVANLTVWSLWWPALLLTAFFVARGWCSYCPLEAIGEFVGAKARVIRDPPPWLKRGGAALSLTILVLILLLEEASGMFIRPLATGFLLLGLLVATVAADLLLGRRGWCKYLCPLGRIVSVVARISLLEMHSNYNVCTSRCRVDDCVKEKSCPMALHPTGVDNADHCVLCLNCVRSCPHHSMQLDLRNPAWELFSRARRGFAEALFCVTLVGAILAVKGIHYMALLQPEMIEAGVWTVKGFSVAVLFIGLYIAAAFVASIGNRRSRWRATFTLCGLAYLPMAVVALFLLYFRPLLEKGADIIPLTLIAFGLAGWFDLAALTPELGTLRLLIVPLLLVGTFFSWQALGRLQQHYALNRFGIAAHRMLVLFSAAAFLWLL